MWAIEEEERRRRVIGMINYHRRDLREQRVDVGWLMLPDRQGKGYMTEAGRALLRYLIDELGIHKVEALIAAGEQAVGRARQAAGISPGGRADPRPLVGRRPLA